MSKSWEYVDQLPQWIMTESSLVSVTACVCVCVFPSYLCMCTCSFAFFVSCCLLHVTVLFARCTFCASQMVFALSLLWAWSMTSSLHAVNAIYRSFYYDFSCVQAFCIAYMQAFFVCFFWYHAHIFNMYLWCMWHDFFSHLSCVAISVYICIMYVIMLVDVCIFLLLRGNTFVWAVGRAVVLPSSQAASPFFASVLYICLYKYVQRIMCPLPLLFMRATFVKFTVAAWKKKNCPVPPSPTQSGACCTWWKQDFSSQA